MHKQMLMFSTLTTRLRSMTQYNDMAANVFTQSVQKIIMELSNKNTTKT